jgi:hypothetical protein
VPLIEHATRIEFAGGLSAKFLPNLSLYAQAGYQFTTSSELRRDEVKGRLRRTLLVVGLFGRLCGSSQSVGGPIWIIRVGWV